MWGVGKAHTHIYTFFLLVVAFFSRLINKGQSAQRHLSCVAEH